MKKNIMNGYTNSRFKLNFTVESYFIFILLDCIYGNGMLAQKLETFLIKDI